MLRLRQPRGSNLADPTSRWTPAERSGKQVWMAQPTTPELAADPVVRAFLTQVRACIDIERVVLFGSRSRGDHRPRSDYDLALSAPGMTPIERSAFAARWQESKPTLLATDLVWLDELTDNALAERIRAEGVEIYAR